MRFAATIYSEIIVCDDVLYDAFTATIPTGGEYMLCLSQSGTIIVLNVTADMTLFPLSYRQEN